MSMASLTQAQVDALPTGTKVTIKWSDGNGPWTYTVWSQNGEAYTTNQYYDGIKFRGNRIAPVGNHPLTSVNLAENA